MGAMSNALIFALFVIAVVVIIVFVGNLIVNSGLTFPLLIIFIMAMIVFLIFVIALVANAGRK